VTAPALVSRTVSPLGGFGVGFDGGVVGLQLLGFDLPRPLHLPLGVGLGTYIPANNTAIMTAIPPGQAAAAGGMVNMARGLGTALGVAVVTLALHAAARLGHPSAGQAAAMAALTLCALASAWAGRRVSAGHHSQTVSAGGRDSGAVTR
jgi:hypothetical protein